MPYCPECGAGVSDDQTYCRECGGRLYEPPEPDAGDEDGRRLEAREDEKEPGSEFEEENLLSFSFSYPVRSGFTPVVVGGGLGVLYGFLLYSLYFVAIFLLFPIALVGSAGWRGVGGNPGTSAALILVVAAGYLIYLLVSLVPLYPVAGYYVELTGRAAEGVVEPPGFDEWGALFRDGFKSLAGIAIPLYLVTSAASFVPVAAAQYYTSLPLEPLGWLASLVSVLLWLYLAPPLLVNYSVTRRLRDAYDPGRFRAFAAKPSYQLYFLGSLILAFALVITGTVVAALSVLTIVGWIFVVPATVFYGYAVMAAYWGRVYYETVPP